jgi:hypothetical protein
MAEPQRKISTSKPSGRRANAARAKSGGKATGARSGSTTSGRASRSPSTAKKRASQTRSGSNSSNRATRSTGKASGTKRTTRSNGSSTKSRAATPATSNGRASSSGIADTIKDVASKAKGPAVAVGAAAAGVAGGLVIRNRTRRKTVLGVPLPKHLPTVDPQAMVKSVGKATKQFAKTSKSVSKDIERAGDQAERIGKILG